jgi:Zn-dependent protease/CBS domain-containing protein
MEERANKPLGERPAGRGLFIGRLLGIEFYLDYSWFLIAAIVTYQLAQEEFPLVHPGHAPFVYVIMGAVAAILFFLSIILHELGHSVVSQRCGIPVSRITLLFIGGLAEIAREPDDARSELKIALGGPLVSVVLIAVFGALAWFCALTGLGAAQAVCLWLALTNLVLVIFNMIPGYPLDGGRVLRALLWARSGRLRQSTYITSRIGIAFGWFLMAFGTWALLAWHQWNAIVLFLIALFLKSAAENGYTAAIQREVLGGVRVRDVMTPRPTSMSATLPLNLAVDDFFLSNHHVAFPVCDTDGDFRGLLRLEFLRDLPREKWPYTTAGDLVAEKGGASLQIESDETAARAMRRLLAPDQGRLGVVVKGKLVGMITRHDILHVIEIHSELEA